MRSSAVIAASLAGNALAVPFFKRSYETEIDLVTITKYITATGPCPSTTPAPETQVITAAASGWLSSFFNPLPTTSSVVVVTSITQAPSEAPVPETTAVAPSPEATTYTVSETPSSTPVVVPETTPEVVASTSAVVATSSAAVVTSSEAPATTEAPSTTSQAAGGISTYARCATSSVDSTASLTAEPTGTAAKRWLAFHNAHRANHTDGCSLYWDYDLEAKAMESANTCTYEHTVTDTSNFGQNMGEMSYTTSVGSVSQKNMDSAPEFFTSMYYEEYNDFGPYWGAETVPTDGPNILHLTQMLWQKSYAVGCATQSCTDTKMMLTFCNYRSRGNILNEYGDNVGLFIDSPLPPICSEIGSTATDGSCITDEQLGL